MTPRAASLLGLVLLAAAGCGGQTTGPPDSAASTTTTDPSPAGERGEMPSVDDLRALPYTGFTAAGEDRDKSGVVVLDRARSEPGYNLTTHRSLCSAELLSATGRALIQWTLPHCRQWSNILLLENGDVAVIGMDEEPGLKPYELRYVARLGWSGELRWKRRLPAHHDLSETPGEGLLVLTAGYRDAPEIAGSERLYDNRLTLLGRGGEVLEEVSAYDLFRAGPFPFTFQPVAAKETQDGDVAVDLFHLNSVQWNPYPELADRYPLFGPDNVLVCSRHQDTVAILDWRTKELVWAWGQGVLSGPHDASWLANGHLLVFDNGLERGWSRVVEVDPATGEIVWQYRDEQPEGFFTLSRGSAQRLANGDTLIAESDRGRAFEVTPDGEIVWEYFSPHVNEQDERATIVRMKRHPAAEIDAFRAGHRPASQ